MPTIENERIEALYLHLTEDKQDTLERDDLTESSYNDQEIEYGNNESYLVVTDDEADKLWDESLESYIDDCILPELNEHYRMYFDNERWKGDARTDGRAHSLDHYSGDEYTQTVNGTEYYIYRQN